LLLFYERKFQIKEGSTVTSNTP